MSIQEKPGVLEYQGARAAHRKLLVAVGKPAADIAEFDRITIVMLDKLGMNWARVPISRVKAGTKLVTDDGFTCMKDHAHRTVMKDRNGELYVRCDEGHHGLDGQITDDGHHYTGFWFAGKEPAL